MNTNEEPSLYNVTITAIFMKVSHFIYQMDILIQMALSIVLNNKSSKKVVMHNFKVQKQNNTKQNKTKIHKTFASQEH